MNQKYILANNSKAIKKENQEHYQKEELVPNATTALMTKNSSTAHLSFSGGLAADLKAALWSMISQNGTVFICTFCGKNNLQRK